MPHKQRRYHCRQQGCPNTYTDVLGGEQAFGKHFAGADCIPCYIAAQLHDNGQTPEMIERIPALRARCEQLLRNTGWTLAHVQASYTRHPVIF